MIEPPEPPGSKFVIHMDADDNARRSRQDRERREEEWRRVGYAGLSEPDRISALVEEMDRRAKTLGLQHGQWKPGMRLGPLHEVDRESVPEALATILLSEHRIVSLQRVGDAWGLYVRVIEPLSGSSEDRYPIRLRDASLEIKRAFLAQSVEFFESYLAARKSATEARAHAITEGERAIRFLDRAAPKK